MLLTYLLFKSYPWLNPKIFTVANPGGWGMHPHRPQTPRPRKKFLCENSKVFRRFAPIIVQLIKNKIQQSNWQMPKLQGVVNITSAYFLHAWG
jgi:hypothetical protein